MGRSGIYAGPTREREKVVGGQGSQGEGGTERKTEGQGGGSVITSSPTPGGEVRLTDAGLHKRQRFGS